ncbi:MAG: hypothetical protein ACI4BB_00520 [Coprococcus sp.]
MNVQSEYKEKQHHRISREQSGIFLELDSLIIEYKNLFDRSNKLDNKVYITITFCGFLFVFITSLFGSISKFGNVTGHLDMLLVGLYIISCIAVMVSYGYLLIYFMHLLKPEGIVRMDPDILKRAGLETVTESEAAVQLITLYRRAIDEDLIKLKKRCDNFTRGLRYVILTVILAFIAYVLQLLISIFH